MSSTSVTLKKETTSFKAVQKVVELLRKAESLGQMRMPSPDTKGRIGENYFRVVSHKIECNPDNIGSWNITIELFIQNPEKASEYVQNLQEAMCLTGL